MKKVMILGALAFTSLSASAQRTPQPSPAASVMQTVGVTDLTVKYSRPSLKGRAAFGDSSNAKTARGYGQLWRTGANAATTFETSTDVTVEGQNLPAGKYSIVSIPTANEWTVIFSKDLGVSEQSYKQENDVLRVMAKPTVNASKTESFSIGFSNITDSSASMYFAWDNVKTYLGLGVKTNAIVQASMDKALAEKPEDPATNQRIANYNLNKGKDLEASLGMIDKAIAGGENYQKLWTKAQLLMKLARFKDALPVAQKALALGNATPDNAFNVFFKGQIENGMKDIQGKLPKVEDVQKVLPTKKKRG